MDLWMIRRMLFKEAEAELGGADSCSQPVTFYIGRARKFFAPDFVKWIMMIVGLCRDHGDHDDRDSLQRP